MRVEHNDDVHLEIENRTGAEECKYTQPPINSRVGFNYEPGRCLPFYFVFTRVARRAPLHAAHSVHIVSLGL